MTSFMNGPSGSVLKHYNGRGLKMSGIVLWKWGEGSEEIMGDVDKHNKNCGKATQLGDKMLVGGDFYIQFQYFFNAEF